MQRPAAAPPRKRRFEDGHGDEEGEEQRIRAALAAKPRGAEMLDLMDLAIELRMRQSEVLGITAGQCKRVRGTAIVLLPDTKPGVPREVPLSKARTSSSSAGGQARPPTSDCSSRPPPTCASGGARP